MPAKHGLTCSKSRSKISKKNSLGSSNILIYFPPCIPTTLAVQKPQIPSRATYSRQATTTAKNRSENQTFEEACKDELAIKSRLEQQLRRLRFIQLDLLAQLQESHSINA